MRIIAGFPKQLVRQAWITTLAPTRQGADSFRVTPGVQGGQYSTAGPRRLPSKGLPIDNCDRGSGCNQFFRRQQANNAATDNADVRRWIPATQSPAWLRNGFGSRCGGRRNGRLLSRLWGTGQRDQVDLNRSLLQPGLRAKIRHINHGSNENQMNCQ